MVDKYGGIIFKKFIFKKLNDIKIRSGLSFCLLPPLMTVHSTGGLPEAGYLSRMSGSCAWMKSSMHWCSEERCRNSWKAVWYRSSSVTRLCRGEAMVWKRAESACACLGRGTLLGLPGELPRAARFSAFYAHSCPQINRLQRTEAEARSAHTRRPFLQLERNTHAPLD